MKYSTGGEVPGCFSNGDWFKGMPHLPEQHVARGNAEFFHKLAAVPPTGSVGVSIRRYPWQELPQEASLVVCLGAADYAEFIRLAFFSIIPNSGNPRGVFPEEITALIFFLFYRIFRFTFARPSSGKSLNVLQLSVLQQDGKRVKRRANNALKSVWWNGTIVDSDSPQK